jgi:hypothetical protein
MENIIITNTIAEDKIHLNFDLSDGKIPFPPIELSTSGDIELNTLVIKLTELLELNRKVEVKYSDDHSIIESTPKVKLIVDALNEIYNSFNSNIIIEDDDGDDDHKENDLF